MKYLIIGVLLYAVALLIHFYTSYQSGAVIVATIGFVFVMIGAYKILTSDN